MRPLYLRGMNWRGYASLELDLRGVRSVLIHGETGAGKSNIPGLMLWCLTGENGSPDPRGHCRQGADQVQGELHFARGGALYRILRTQSFRGARPKSDLQFAVADGRGGWIPKTGRSIEETQRAITDLLGMGYEELTCGPFSLQEQAGRFVDPPELRIDGKVYKGRSARLQVTIKMLGLQQWEQWRIQAGKAERAAADRAAALERTAAELHQHLAGRAGLAAEVAAAEAGLAGIRERAQAARAALDRGIPALAALEAGIPALERELLGYTGARATLARRLETRAGLAARADRYRDLLARRLAIEAALHEAAALDARLAAQREQLAALGAEGKGAGARAQAAEAEAGRAEAAARQAAERLREARARDAQRGALAARAAALQAQRAEREALARRIAEADEALAAARAELDHLRVANQAATQRAGEIEAEAGRVAAEIRGLEPRIADCDRRVAVLGQVPCLGQAELVAACPLLAEAREAGQAVAALKAQLAALCAWRRPEAPAQRDSSALVASLRRMESSRAEAQGRLVALDRTIASLMPVEGELSALDAVAAMLPGLEAQAEAAEAARAEAAEAVAASRAQLADIRMRSLELQRRLQAGEAARAALATDGAEALGLAAQELPRLEAELAELDEIIRTLTEQLGAERDALARLDGARAQAAALRADLARARADLAQHQAEEQTAVEALAQGRARLAMLDGLTAQAEAAAAEAAALRGRHTLLALLGEAYRQIPIMILDNIARPLLEAEANRVLARTSRNRMQVRIETQREVKSRDALADGLEIYVRDWRGERSLAEYSGGQKFELYLAFRIAWTRLQERRSGRGIDCLLVDEGFGSLSAGDLEAVMAALRECQAEFGFLAVISHVEAMRDLFPARIQVTGGHEDSRAELVTP